MATTTRPPNHLHAPRLGEEGEPCASCGAPLAADQRYCLNCGTRRAEARLPFLDVLREEYATEHARVIERERLAASPEPRPVSPLLAGGVVAIVVLVLALGVLIGVLSGGSKTAKVASTPVVVNGGGSGSSTNASSTAFQDDWPSGKDAWTVDLQELPKASTQPDAVATAKSAATAKGAPQVGALDADSYSGLPTGNYIVFSGQYGSQKDAQSALDKLKANFPQAKVVHVTPGGGASGGSGSSSSTPSGASTQPTPSGPPVSNKQAEKQVLKQPQVQSTPGTAPPKDNKPAGGGQGGGSVIQ